MPITSVTLTDPFDGATSQLDNVWNYTVSGLGGYTGTHIKVNGETEYYNYPHVSTSAGNKTYTINRSKLSEGTSNTWQVGVYSSDIADWVWSDVTDFTTYSVVGNLDEYNIFPVDGATWILGPDGFPISFYTDETVDADNVQLYFGTSPDNLSYESNFEFDWSENYFHASFDYSGSGTRYWAIATSLWWTKTIPVSSTIHYFVIGGSPGKPINPTPVDTATNVKLSLVKLSWESGS